MAGTIKLMELDKMIPNPNNPRFIRDEKYEILLRRISQSPSFMELRPIIMDKDGVIQGGNMRHRACLELGWVKAPYDIYTEERYQQDVKARKDLAKKNGEKFVKPSYEDMMREFVVVDNLGYGEWDPIMIDEQYTFEELKEYGYDVIEVDDVDLDKFFEETEPKEVSTGTKIVLDYTDEEFDMVMQRFNEIGGSKEKVVWNLLGLNEER